MRRSTETAAKDLAWLRLAGRSYVLIGVTLAAFALLGLRVAQGFQVASVWDDPYMFVRYAQNLIDSGRMAFHASDPGTYGLTAPAFLLVVVPMYLLFAGNPALTVLAASSFSGLIFLAVLTSLLWRQVQAPPAQKRAILLVLVLALLPCVEALAVHFTSGMDTLFVLAWVSGFILVALEQQCSPRPWRALALGLLGGLAFAVRPDTLLLTLAPLAAGIVWSASAAQRRLAAGSLAIAILVAAGSMATAAAWLGSPLPLPFFAKSHGFYGPTIEAVYRDLPLQQLGLFSAKCGLLLAMIAVAVATSPRGFWRRLGPVERGLLLASLLFTAYYAGFVVQVLYRAQRFYFPVLPALVLLAARAAESIAAQWAGWPAGVRRGAAAALVAVSAVVFAKSAVLAARADDPSVTARHGRFDKRADYLARQSHYWARLDAVSDLPEALVIATTEVGAPLALSPGRRIIDLAGLNETALVHGGLSPARLLERERPGLVYLPHPDYAEMIAAIRADAWFAAHYEVIEGAALDAEMGVAILREGGYAEALRTIFDPAQSRVGFGASP